jgi:putative intracellular protease/amidase
MRSTPPRRSRSRTSSASSDDAIRKALASFGGVRRRFTRTGDVERRHHHRRLRPSPGRDRGGARAARESTKGQVIAVVQPHRYTRLRSLFEQFCTCFNDADTVIVAMSIRPASADSGRRSRRLVQGLRITATVRSSRSTARTSLPRWCRNGQAWRLRRLPRRRLDHAMGLCAASCLAVRHVAFEDLGLLAPLVAARGYDVRYHEAGVDRFDADTLLAPDLVVVLGGPIGVYEARRLSLHYRRVAAIAARLRANKPLLGICLGAQMMAAALGARVAPGPVKEIGWAPLTLTPWGSHRYWRRLRSACRCCIGTATIAICRPAASGSLRRHIARCRRFHACRRNSRCNFTSRPSLYVLSNG